VLDPAFDGKRVLRVVPSADLSELDPTMGADLISRIYQQMVFDTPFALDSNLSPKPMMVDRETISPDGLVYTFTLRSGLRFHDGSAVTTAGVIATLQRWMRATSVGAQLQSRLAELAMVDNLTFTLSLKQPFGLVEFMLAGPRSPIPGIMREADETRPASQKMTDPIGSGPSAMSPHNASSALAPCSSATPTTSRTPNPPTASPALGSSKSIASNGQ
jgi:peptide/nickel transport system substrate-binding protein